MPGTLTPMMRQYMQIKEENPDAILMYRLGDFYEMFFEDARTAARELNLVLTGRDCGLQERAPMCGVPHHAIETYVGQLVSKGHKVAICEQLEDPKSTKGLVQRGITRLVTPGTVFEESLLSSSENNYLMSVVPDGEFYGISWCDVSTGEFQYQDMLNENELASEIEKRRPREFLVPEELYDASRQRIHDSAFTGAVTPYSNWAFRRDNARDALTAHFKVSSLRGFDIDMISAGVRASGALIRYLHDSQNNALSHISKLRSVRATSHMVLDTAAIRNLELVRTLLTGNRRGSLLGLIDRTRTAAGGRLLRKMLLEPLRSRDEIEQRLDAVEAFVKETGLADDVRGILEDIRDLERILARLSYGAITAEDCVSLRRTLQLIPQLRNILEGIPCELVRSLRESLDELPAVRQMLVEAIKEDATGVAGSGTVIRRGYSAELDELTVLNDDGAIHLAHMESQERECTGIKSLKIRYNRVFGYYIEIPKSYKGEVPVRFVRRQTLANAERYVTDDLKQLEEMLLSAAEQRRELEKRIFGEVCARLAEHIPALQQIARSLAMLDVLQSLARVSSEQSFVRPTITDDDVIKIRGGRHPVVESLIRDGFVPNDLELGQNGSQMMLITGPNMAGKSTYMRQTGIIVLLAHVGCFVPADEASICLVDRIFTRVGASDDLASGQSTFMVEMNELATILNNATRKSLIILDEVGRGTGTEDGLAIARAAAVYILTELGAKTMFATHFHELTSLSDEYDGVVNRSVAVKEIGDEIVFLHRIVDGGTNRSFGIEVARLAGVPEQVTRLAQRYLDTVRTVRSESVTRKRQAETAQLSALDQMLQDVRGLNPDVLTPLEALSYIYGLKTAIIDAESGGPV